VRVLARNVGLPREVLRLWAVTGITAAHLDGALEPSVSFEDELSRSPNDPASCGVKRPADSRRS
jgi:hypothetical protein